MHPHETARLDALLQQIGLAHHLDHSERRKNAAAGFNPYSYNDPRHEPMQREIERIERVRAARARRRVG
jgi:hypothetical protein